MSNLSYRILIIAGTLLATSPALLAGSLTPSGPPAPSMKTLVDIEPRVLIAPADDSLQPVEIDQPGSYYLGRNLLALPDQHGITISASNVTLDLNGFTVHGNLEVNDGTGIDVSGDNVVIRNGQVTYFDENGIACSGDSLTLINVNSTHNGKSGVACASLRIDGGDFSYNGENGIGGLFVNVTRASANHNGTNGIGMGGDSRVSDSSFTYNTGFGIACPQGNALVAQIVSKHNDAGNRVGCTVFNSEIP